MYIIGTNCKNRACDILERTRRSCFSTSTRPFLAGTGEQISRSSTSNRFSCLSPEATDTGTVVLRSTTRNAPKAFWTFHQHFLVFGFLYLAPSAVFVFALYVLRTYVYTDEKRLAAPLHSAPSSQLRTAHFLCESLTRVMVLLFVFQA